MKHLDLKILDTASSLCPGSFDGALSLIFEAVLVELIRVLKCQEIRKILPVSNTLVGLKFKSDTKMIGQVLLQILQIRCNVDNLRCLLFSIGLATELFQRKGVQIPVLTIKSVPVSNTRPIDGIPMNQSRPVALISPSSLEELALEPAPEHALQSLVIASLLGDIKQAALDRAGASLRVADKRSDTGCRVATLVGTASWEVDERLDVAG